MEAKAHIHRDQVVERLRPAHHQEYGSDISSDALYARI
jgi:hypothetical protein